MSFLHSFALLLSLALTAYADSTPTTITVAGVPITIDGTTISVPSSSTADSAGLASIPLASAAAVACALTSLDIGSAYVESSGSEYESTVENTWNLFNSFDSPSCIVYPESSAHVQSAMKNIYRMGAKYAVQAGAHSAMVGWNSITDGVLISFARMDTTTYNPTTDTITVLPGVRWGEAADAVQEFGVSAIGGRASDVGTGLLLGGGISFMSPLYGWSADRIKEMDVVLVTGDLLTVSATNQYADLFQALKGGANRFGIVTRYGLHAAHTGTKDDKEWFGGVISYPGSAAQALSDASAKYIRETTDPKAAIPSTSQTLSPLSYHDISHLIPGDARGSGQQFGASSIVGDEALYWDAYTHFRNFSNAFTPTSLASSFFILSPIPSFQWSASGGGENAMGSPGVSYGAINYWLIYQPTVKSKPQAVQEGFELLFQQAPSTPGVPLYVNEADASQNSFATYPNYAKLQATYAKYDPLRFNVLHTEGPIGL
ncbi:FAD-binding protein [Favolaschia claudopus]|uniref:FAD-binding protein n=1 Tax=Favolaschia claudopus TaxID=2862362 RepID=A0AAW0D5U2_9AGAR